MLVPAAYLEMVGVRLWTHYSEKNKCQFNLICLHLMAHLQHNYMHDKINFTSSTAWKEGSAWFEKIFNLVIQYAQEQNAEIVIMNGFQQTHFTEAGQHHYIYKLKNLEQFLYIAMIRYKSAYPHMTAEQTIYFSNKNSYKDGIKKLSSAMLNNTQAFKIKTYPNSLKIFFKLISHEKINEESDFTINGNNYRFSSLFSSLGLETGSHSNQGFLYYKNFNFPENIELSHIKSFITNHFSSR